MIFNKKNFLIFALAPSGNDYGSKTGGIHVTHKHTEVTNGHYAVRIAVPPNGDAKVELPKSKHHKRFKRKRIDVVISKAAAESVLKGIPGTGFACDSLTWVGRRTEDEHTEFVSSEFGITRSAVVENIEGKFPDIEPVIKSQSLRRKPRVEVGFNPEYMKKLCDFFIKSKIRNVKMSLFAPDKAMVLEDSHDGKEGRQAVYVLLMPSALPGYVKPKKAEPQEEKGEVEKQ